MPFLKSRSKIIISRSRRLENLANKNGLRHAFFNAGDKYNGEWKDNKKSGSGSLLTEAKMLYEGEFERGYRHGFGVLARELDCKVFTLEYRGEWKNGRMHGFGLRIYPDNSFYLGQWRYGKRHGYGQMWYIDGSFFDGDWVRDMKEGLGMLVRADGSRYEGLWKSDMKHGKGKFFHMDSGQLQEGVWAHDVAVFSKICDIPYRQTAVSPTRFPIRQLEVIDVENICTLRELKALSEEVQSCLTHISEEVTPVPSMLLDSESEEVMF